jgi:hypothetical protein
MIFFIQVSEPKINKEFDSLESSIRDLLEDLFPMETEDAIMCWNSVLIPLSYKYDIPIMIEDIVDMIENILANNNGKIVINWPSDTFNAKWNIEWGEGKLKCKAIWYSISGNIEEVLNKSGYVEIDVDQFLAEWINLLSKIVEKMEQAKINILHLDFGPQIKALVDKNQTIKAYLYST